MTDYTYLNGNADGVLILQRLFDFLWALVVNGMLLNPQFYVIIGVGVIIAFIAGFGGNEREYRFARY